MCGDRPTYEAMVERYDEQIAALKADFTQAEESRKVNATMYERALANCQRQAEEIARLREALGALGTAADKVHKVLNVIQPFLRVFMEHGILIADCMTQDALKQPEEKTTLPNCRDLSRERRLDIEAESFQPEEVKG